ncbi:carotenoid biosynthesis protein [Bacillus weihaiensis]|uniref:Carotenoid biosynthesis protein n=1 Tax=Bacillus weihaiensis TaxID=1547283 RepID=A0A1L3MUE0_9BACI|nr:carotenoid biosynthesis protein [Bacillus weihaiensis]APH05957.1 hypothetical protein A9C19_15115 [Bacillus weihaiensis]
MKLDENIFKLFVLWYVIGVVLLTFDLIPPYLEWANVVFLVLAGTIGGIYFTHTFGRKMGFSISIFVILFSIAAEHLGVEYGLLFGDYYYTSDFGPQILGVPVAIGFAWLLVIAGTHAITKVIIGETRFLSFTIVASLLTVLIDLIIDPVAFEVKHYWVWNAESFYYNVPMSNFIGWFVVGYFIHSVIYLVTMKQPIVYSKWHSRMVLVYFLVLAMFVLLAAIHTLWLAVLLTGSLALLTLFFYIRNRNEGTPA